MREKQGWRRSLSGGGRLDRIESRLAVLQAERAQLKRELSEAREMAKAMRTIAALVLVCGVGVAVGCCVGGTMAIRAEARGVSDMGECRGEGM